MLRATRQTNTLPTTGRSSFKYSCSSTTVLHIQQQQKQKQRRVYVLAWNDLGSPHGHVNRFVTPLLITVNLYLLKDIGMAYTVVVVVLTLKTVLTSIQYLLFLTLQGKETNFRGHKLTQNKAQKNKSKIKKTQIKSQHLREKYDTGS